MTEYRAQPHPEGGYVTGNYEPRRVKAAGAIAPVITAATITAGVGALITLLVAFGVPITTEQESAILGLVAVLGPIIVAVVGARTTVEYTAGGEVIRGAANEGPTGEVVRPLGTLEG